MNKTVNMGDYYQSKVKGLVKTVCRAKDAFDTPYIVYVPVLDGGIAGDILIMEEENFYEEFLTN